MMALDGAVLFFLAFVKFFPLSCFFCCCFSAAFCHLSAAFCCFSAAVSGFSSSFLIRFSSLSAFLLLSQSPLGSSSFLYFN